MKFPFSVLLAMSLIACGEEEPKEEVDPLTVDDDGDGFTEEQGDCDDANADINPSASEDCDEIDNDCDGAIDDEDDSLNLDSAMTFYADADMDGFGDAATEMKACVMPEAASDNMDDCDDANDAVNPDAAEVCDAIDNDCDALIDDADDSLDGSTGTEYWADADGDGEGDADASMWACEMPEAHVDNMTDCDDTNAALNNADVDQDGLTTCANADGVADCDDTGATDLTDTSQDGDCDGTLTADDCDDMDPMSTIMADDMDCDGLLPVADGGTDCDDMDDTIGATDGDGDGFLACDGDCDDADASLYPGVAFNEADPTLCVADADGDGYANYADIVSISCFDIEMTDTYGDGWNGNAIEVYEDGMLTGTYANEDLDGVTGSETQTVQHCVDSATTMVEFGFVDGSYNYEVEFTISDSNTGNVFGMGEGTGTSDVIWEGTTFTDGDVFYDIADVTAVELLTGGSDCDDADASTFGDDDGDGYTYCTTDCDDTDATLNGDDPDGDGYSTCDGDCNEDTADADADGVADGAAFNPGVSETYYDGIDSDCDGMSDFDADGDGYESMEYSGSCSDASLMNMTDCLMDGACTEDATLTTEEDCTDMGTCSDGTSADESSCDTAGETWTPYTWVATNQWTSTGLDCNDNSAYYAPLSMEADATACYYDYDEDGYGDSTPGTTQQNYGVVAGTDCWDGFGGEFTFPGAAFNDSMTECMEDEDGDGFGAVEPTISSWSSDDGPVVGTDCDDLDDTTVGDDDMDGFTTCADANGLIDCNDNDANTFPGAGFNEAGYIMGDYTTYECVTDADGDGYAAAQVVGCYTFDLFDTYGDSWNGGMNIEVFEDGFSVGTATVTSEADAYEVQSTEICVLDGSTVEFVFNDGSFASEIGGTIYDTDGTTIIGALSGSNPPQTLTFDGSDYLDGETFYTATVSGSELVGGSDADDNDATVGPN